jgi:hypothetical protein
LLRDEAAQREEALRRIYASRAWRAADLYWRSRRALKSYRDRMRRATMPAPGLSLEGVRRVLVHPLLGALRETVRGRPAALVTYERSAEQAAAFAPPAGGEPTLAADRGDRALAPRQIHVDLVVAVHGPVRAVATCLLAITHCTMEPYSLVVVDDANEDDTRGYLLDFALAEGALLLRTQVRTGFGAALAMGVRHSISDRVVLLTSDTLVAAHWLDPMVAKSESDLRIGLVELQPPYENGHCFLLRRGALEALGCFADGGTAGKGIFPQVDRPRIVQAGWRIASCDALPRTRKRSRC